MNSKMVKNHNYLVTLKILILFRVFKVLFLMIISSLLANYRDEVSKKREIGKSTHTKKNLVSDPLKSFSNPFDK